MSAHQKTTTATYDAVADAFRDQTRSHARGLAWVERFASLIPAEGLVADLGSGPGRDTAQLRARGVNAFCLDLSMGMLQAGLGDYPASRVQASLLALPLQSASCAGAWANASLLHLTPEELRLALSEIRRILAPSGVLHVTVKRGRGSEWESDRYGLPRWFHYWSGSELDRALEEAGLQPIARSEEQATSATWVVRLCRAA